MKEIVFFGVILLFSILNHLPHFANLMLLSLELSESLDRRGINLVARTYKTNKVPAVVCRPAL